MIAQDTDGSLIGPEWWKRRKMSAFSFYVKGHSICNFCEEVFTVDEWDQRHSDAEGEDVHEECCEICHGDDPDCGERK